MFCKLEVEICAFSLCHGCKNSYSCYTNCHGVSIFCSSAKVYGPIPGPVELETTNTLHEDVYMFMLASRAQVVKYLLTTKNVSNRHCGAKQSVCLIHRYLLVVRLWELVIARLIQ